MAERKKSDLFIKLKESACKCFSKPFILNDTEFIIVPRDEGLKIHKYNIHSDEWKKWIDCGSLVDEYYSCVAFDYNNKTLYIAYDQSILIIDLQTHKNSIIEHSINFGSEAASIFVKGQLHIVGGDNNVNHYIWNEKEHKFDLLYKFSVFQEGYSCHELIYLRSKDSLLLMGGWDDGNSEPLDTIFMYSFAENKWNTLKITLPQSLYRYAYSVSDDERFIVLLGDYDDNDIYVWHLETMRFRQCKIRCPEYFKYVDALTMTDSTTKENELLVFGYLRYCNQLFGVGLPLDIMNAIKAWCCTEYVYLIDSSSNQYHWKIKLKDILNN